MFNASFNPYHLQPLASLNQRRIIALPGMEEEIVGKTGYEVASKPALIRLIGAQAQVLGLESENPEDYPQCLNGLLESSDAQLRIASEAIAECHGRRVGCLIASILLSKDGLTNPLDALEAHYLHWWREQVGTLILGGGLANGRLGQVISREISRVLGQNDLSHIHVQTTENPSNLPLIGAARSLLAGQGRLAVVADFGGTHAKRGLAFYAEEGSLQRLEVLPPCTTTALITPGKTTELAEGMVSILAETARAAPQDKALLLPILCSAAAYVEAGKPMKVYHLGYYALNQISTDLLSWFSDKISQESGRKVRLEFLHDCDAAAIAMAGKERSAVLMLGSALGVGFVPNKDRDRPISPDFELVYRIKV